MNLLAQLTLAMAVVGCASQQEMEKLDLLKVEHSTDSGMKEVYTAYLNGKWQMVRHGTYIVYYPGGAKYLEAHFVHGKLDGELGVFTERGKAIIVGLYKQGKPWEGVFLEGHQCTRYREGRFSGTVTNLGMRSSSKDVFGR
jgi:antitoxin component YwqK of YwqJK toxin-antitoxin module